MGFDAISREMKLSSVDETEVSSMGAMPQARK